MLFWLLRAKLVQEMSKESEDPLTDYVSTRWYRSPELLLGDQVSYFCVVGTVQCVR